jgi:hypothetical protein
MAEADDSEHHAHMVEPWVHHPKFKTRPNSPTKQQAKVNVLERCASFVLGPPNELKKVHSYLWSSRCIHFYKLIKNPKKDYRANSKVVTHLKVAHPNEAGAKFIKAEHEAQVFVLRLLVLFGK